MIPIVKESKELFNEFGVYEKCVFCKEPTKTWHTKTNNPVCSGCSKTHKVNELINHMKNRIFK
jgi:hypothetical protein